MNEFLYYLHYFYAIVMISGAIYFYILSRNPKGVPAYEYAVAIFIPIWSGASYLSIGLGQGFIKDSDHIIFFARYIDWFVTTPLLLVALALTAMFYSTKNYTLIFTLVFSDVIMILTGLIADFTNSNLKYLWYSIGVLALIVILFTIWKPLYDIAKASDHRLSKHYRNVTLYLTVLWICYPTVWILGPSGIGILTEGLDVILFILLPILSKVGFSIFDLAGLRNLSK